VHVGRIGTGPVGCGLDVDGAGESGAEGLGGGAMVDVEISGGDDEVVDAWEVGGTLDEVVEVTNVDVVIETDVVLGATVLELFPIVSGFAAAVPVAGVVLALRNEGIQLSSRGWYRVAFADLDAGGVYSGLGFQSKE
jgi:hypothetical protein